jgi:hypothetical protein
MKIFKIELAQNAAAILPEVEYVLKVLGQNANVRFALDLSAEGREPSIGLDNAHTLVISRNFLDRTLNKDQLSTSGFFTNENGNPDHLATAFFCLSSMQEILDDDPDALGRFQYKNSYQFRLGNIKRNVVQECFDNILSALRLPLRNEKSSFFLSHDVDTVYGAVKEDGFNVLKKGRIDLFLSMLFNVAMSKPEWLNIDKIIKLESEYDCYSTFYWIVNKGNIDRVQKNADYNFASPKIQEQFRLVKASGFENGLHKSLSEESFSEEIRKFGAQPTGNRYHYLKFALPRGYDYIEEAGLPLDASLGFSEQSGFRNNYGLPVNPYNVEKRRPYTFVEVPLHVMDRTFFNKGMDLQSVEREIFEFFDANRENAVLSVLWHNNFFTGYKYKGYLSLYKKILAYIRDGKFETINQEQIIQNYRIAWP